MTKQAFIYLLVLVIGAAGGAGLGYLMTQAKIDEANIVADELAAQLEAQAAEAQADLETINTKVTRLEADLVRARNDLMRKNTELLRAQTDMEKMKTLVQQTLNPGAGGGGTAAAQPPATTTRTPPTAQRPSANQRTTTPAAAPTGTRSYTIQDGDSLWRIAATELGSGPRYKEILTLNPNLTETGTLTVGSQILLPAR